MYKMKEGRISYIENNKELGYAVFPKVDENTIDIKGTYVDETMRNRGIASKLIENIVEFAIKEDLKIIPTCPFAKYWFEENPEYGYLLK